MILSWFYNPDGKTVDEIEWSFNTNQRIATKNSSGVSIAPAYTNRVEVSGSATIKLTNIQAKDSGNYDCRVTFTTVDWIINQAELIVVGKFHHLYYLYFLFTLYRGSLILRHVVFSY